MYKLLTFTGEAFQKELGRHCLQDMTKYSQPYLEGGGRRNKLHLRQVTRAGSSQDYNFKLGHRPEGLPLIYSEVLIVP